MNKKILALCCLVLTVIFNMNNSCYAAAAAAAVDAEAEVEEHPIWRRILSPGNVSVKTNAPVGECLVTLEKGKFNIATEYDLWFSPKYRNTGVINARNIYYEDNVQNDGKITASDTMCTKSFLNNGQLEADALKVGRFTLDQSPEKLGPIPGGWRRLLSMPGPDGLEIFTNAPPSSCKFQLRDMAPVIQVTGDLWCSETTIPEQSTFSVKGALYFGEPRPFSDDQVKGEIPKGAIESSGA